VLFSEPKISQMKDGRILVHKYVYFSALQRAENFSNSEHVRFLKRQSDFSALQRAENFSKQIL